MADILQVLIPLLLGLALGGAGFGWLSWRAAQRREALQALAARRGWSLTLTPQRLGRPALLRLSARSGTVWTVTTSAASAQDWPEKGARQMTEFQIEDPRWTEATLVIQSTAADPGLAAADPGPTPLLPWPARGGWTARASLDPARRLDLAALCERLDGWTPLAEGAAGRPVLTLGPEGLRIRLRHGLARADHMEAFTDFAQEIARSL